MPLNMSELDLELPVLLILQKELDRGLFVFCVLRVVTTERPDRPLAVRLDQHLVTSLNQARINPFYQGVADRLHFYFCAVLVDTLQGTPSRLLPATSGYPVTESSRPCLGAEGPVHHKGDPHVRSSHASEW